MRLIFNQGFWYILHPKSNKTWKYRYEAKADATACLCKLLTVWTHDPKQEAFDLASKSFLTGDEICKTIRRAS